MLRNINLINKITYKAKQISPSVRVLDRASEIADLVLQKEAKYSKKSNKELKTLSYRIIDEVAKGIPLDNFLIDGLAICREVIYRVHKLKAYRVQIIGAIVAHFGDFAEMKTGEGKTLTLLLVSYVNALTKKGVHIVTVNEYLVKRDMEFSSTALNALGVTVGYITSDMKPNQKREMYACDITYISNSELGFDYLRDNMVHDANDKMQRGLNFAIVDEADSILVDEARTPLIIAGNPEEGEYLYKEVDTFVKSLEPNDYVIDLESHAINLNDNGIAKAELFFKIDNLYDIENSSIVHKMMNALRANYIMEVGKEYIVRYNAEKHYNEIALVDSFTGRIMEGRMYSAGLHQAIQSKEDAHIDPENITLATITYQSFFRLYKKLAGMSGTAMTEKQEFLDIYNMVVVEIPTNKKLIREDQPDFVFGTKQLKWKYVVADIKRRHDIGQPILVGTVSVEDSELLHRLLEHLKIPHNVLNAKNNTIEAQIIQSAGTKGAVTIATNMAGRGTDIKLGPGVIELGGLYVLGTERNESRRIDNQLRGRSGRQGDVGESRFFISLQDSLFKRFASDRFEKAQFKMGEEVIDLKFFSRLLDKTQRRVENMNYDIRKNLIDYDYVLSEQRELMYKQRNSVLYDKNLLNIVRKMIPRVVDVLILVNRNEQNVDMVHVENLLKDIEKKLSIKLDLDVSKLNQLHNSQIFRVLCAEINRMLTAKFNEGDKDQNNKMWCSIIINCMDTNWTKFLDRIQKLRDGVSLRSYEQRSPLNIYVEDSDRLFYNITISIAEEVIKNIVEFDTQTEYQENPDAAQLKFIDRSKINRPSEISQHTLDELALSASRNNAQSQVAKNINPAIDNVVDQIWEQTQKLKTEPNPNTNVRNSIDDTINQIFEQSQKLNSEQQYNKDAISPVNNVVDQIWEQSQQSKLAQDESEIMNDNVINVVDEIFNSIKSKENSVLTDTEDASMINNIKTENIAGDHNTIVVDSKKDGENDFIKQMMNSLKDIEIEEVNSDEIIKLLNKEEVDKLENIEFGDIEQEDVFPPKNKELKTNIAKSSVTKNKEPKTNVVKINEVKKVVVKNNEVRNTKVKTIKVETSKRKN